MRILSLICPVSLLLCMFGGCLLLPQPACALELGCSEARDFLEALRREGH